jgi:serine protease
MSVAPAAGQRIVPNDPGDGGRKGWRSVQWHLVGRYGIDAPAAWRASIGAGRAPGDGVTVAIIDTGVAFRSSPHHMAEPDLSAARFVRGWDFVDNEGFPDDENAHGTVVAALVGEDTDNGIGLAGLAYGTRLMPVRVLGLDRAADDRRVARGMRWAVEHGADVLNLSFNWAPGISAKEVRHTRSAVRWALRHGVVVVASAGNDAQGRPTFPARMQGVIAVGAMTSGGCIANYSNRGATVFAPGGGEDSRRGAPGCRDPRRGERIRVLDWGAGGAVEGTSYAAPLVSGTAAVLLALLPRACRAPDRVARLIAATARTVGGVRLLNAGAAAHAGVTFRRKHDSDCTGPSSVIPQTRVRSSDKDHATYPRDRSISS